MSKFISIKNLAEDDKPREKLTQKGKAALSDAELLAILLGTGTIKKTAIDLAREILQKANNDLNQLARLSIKDLCAIDGIGPAKAITIIAAIELAGRKQASETKAKAQITKSRQAYDYIRYRLEDLPYEEFWILTLNRANTVISEYRISEGGVSATLVDLKKILKIAINDLASSIVLYHNHPSGSLSPSDSDKILTSKIKNAAKELEISVYDHLIISNTGYFSFADHGLL
jgi:DNA repair protein RadC